MDSLIFIDTNIFLDFYRFSAEGKGIQLLRRLLDIKDKLIVTDQIVMEFKKNRQNVILDSYNKMKGPDWSGLKWPVFLSQTSCTQRIKKYKEEISKLHNEIKAELLKALQKPTKNDSVFIEIDKLFSPPGKFYWGKDNRDYESIKSRGIDRFQLGYPPRKEGGISYGDSINWECIIACAKANSMNIIIVSRDYDYGIKIEGRRILNSWLLEDFESRVGVGKTVFLTELLSEALDIIGVGTTDEERKEEMEIKENIAFKDNVVWSISSNAHSEFRRKLDEYCGQPPDYSRRDFLRDLDQY
jgi:hypothetical protein